MRRTSRAAVLRVSAGSDPDEPPAPGPVAGRRRVRAGRLLQILAEVSERTPPSVGGAGLVIDVRSVVVEEAVIHAWVDVDLRLLAGLLDGRVRVLGDLRCHEAVLLREEAEDRPR